MRPRLLYKYKNGNYLVRLYEDGTKEKFTLDDDFKADFPDSIDIKITDYCDLECPMCHEKSTKGGIHGDVNQPFLKTLMPGTELAIGGGNPLAHPDIVSFLETLKDNRLVANITVNERHFSKQKDFIEELLNKKLIHGLGISLFNAQEETIAFAKKHPNVVFHAICGLTDLEPIYDKNLKVLLLGYKRFGRGKDFYSQKIQERINDMCNHLEELYPHFHSISFDNLALKQMKLKERTDKETWERSFMGEDGEASMYIDLVKKEFAVSSVSDERYPLKEDVKEMFQTIRNDIERIGRI